MPAIQAKKKPFGFRLFARPTNGTGGLVVTLLTPPDPDGMNPVDDAETVPL